MTGSQEPRIKIEPERITTDGTGAAMLMAEYGNALDPWQKTVIDCWLGKDSRGNYNVTSAGLSLPRQNGKNVCIEAREFFGLVINGEKILHTAHQVRTSKNSFRRLAAIFTNKKYPEITDIVRNIRYANGEEMIEIDNGGKIMFSARSRQAARGIDGVSLIVFDEAQELIDEQIESVMLTLAASSTKTRQILYTGTPPYPSCPGTVFRRYRNMCLTDPGKHDAWHEWSVEADSIDDINVSEKTLWYMTNPALGVRLSEEFTGEECRTLQPDGFARERLGWWMPEIGLSGNLAIDKDAWSACRSAETKPEGKTAYGVKFSPDGSAVCLCGAVLPAEGAARISMIEIKQTGHGISWLADWLNERYTGASCVVIDGRNGVDVLAERISGTWRAKGSVIRPSAKDIIASVSLLCEAINEQTVTWYEKQEILNESATTALRRKIGNGGGWGFGGDNSIPIEACALAFWGVKTAKRDPSRKMRIG